MTALGLLGWKISRRVGTEAANTRAPMEWVMIWKRWYPDAASDSIMVRRPWGVRLSIAACWL